MDLPVYTHIQNEHNCQENIETHLIILTGTTGLRPIIIVTCTSVIQDICTVKRRCSEIPWKQLLSSLLSYACKQFLTAHGMKCMENMALCPVQFGEGLVALLSCDK